MKSTSVMLYIANIVFGILAAAHVSSSSSSSSSTASSSLLSSSSSSMLRGSNTNHDKRRSLVHTTNAMAPASDISDPKHNNLHRQFRSKRRRLQASSRTSMGKPKGDTLARPASKDGAKAAVDALLLGRFGFPSNVARFEVTNAKTSNSSKEAVPVVAEAAEEPTATASCTSNEECKENEEYCAYNRVCVSLSVLGDASVTVAARIASCTSNAECKENEEYCAYNRVCVSLSVLDSNNNVNYSSDSEELEGYDDTTSGRTTNKDEGLKTQQQQQDHDDENDTTDEKDTVHDAEVITVVEETDSTTTKNQEQEDGAAENDTTDEKKTVHDAKMSTVEETGNTTTKNQEQENGPAENNTNEDTTSSSDNDTTDDKETVHDAKMSAVEETSSTTAKNHQEQEDAETNASEDTNSSSSKTMQILRSVGIAIGAIVAFALLFVVGLWCICFGRVFCRRRRKNQEDRDKSRPLSKVNGNQYNSDDESDHESTLVDDNTLISSSDDEERICNIRFLQVTANASTFESSQCLERVYSVHSA